MSNETAIYPGSKHDIGILANSLGGTLKINAIVATIPVGIYPLGIAITPNNQKVYVTNYKDNTVSVIDTISNKVKGEAIPVGDCPVDIAIMNNGQRAYVINQCGQSFSVINTILDTIIVNNIKSGLIEPKGITILPNDTRVYIADGKDNDIDIISTAVNNRIMSHISSIQMSSDVTVAPDGTTVYAISFSTGVVFAIDVLSNSITKQVVLDELDNDLFCMTITPDGKKLYISTWSGHVYVVKTSDFTLMKKIKISSYWLRGIEVAPDGKKAYVCNTVYNELVVIDVETDTIIGLPYEVGLEPQRIAITSNSKYAYVSNYYDNTVSVIDLTVTTVDG